MALTETQRHDFERRKFYADKYKNDKGVDMCVIFDKRDKVFQGWPLPHKSSNLIVYRTDGGKCDMSIDELDCDFLF